jgi:hypothetical protein
MGREDGQATVEWIALVLLAGLLLAGLLTGAPKVEGLELADGLVRRLSCAVRGECARETAIGPRRPSAASGPTTPSAASGPSAASEASAASGPSAASGASAATASSPAGPALAGHRPSAGGAERPPVLLRHRPSPAWAERPPVLTRHRPSPARAEPPPVLARHRPSPTPAQAARVSTSRAAAAFHALRGIKAIARRAWIVCLGWERYRYERAHPQISVPGRAMPIRDALRIANRCLNPVQFVTEEGRR